MPEKPAAVDSCGLGQILFPFERQPDDLGVLAFVTRLINRHQDAAAEQLSAEQLEPKRVGWQGRQAYAEVRPASKTP